VVRPGAFHIGESGVPEDKVSFVDDDDDPPAPNDNLDVITAKPVDPEDIPIAVVVPRRQSSLRAFHKKTD
jgi:hypothetical protein